MDIQTRPNRRLIAAVILAVSPCLLPMKGLDALASESAPSAAAETILSGAGVQGGLVVHLGCGDGRLTRALHRDEAFLVMGLDKDPEKVRQARKAIRKDGLYGPISAELLEGERLPLADDLVRLLVVDKSQGVPKDEMFRVVCPGGVVAIRDGASWKMETKPWPGGIDEWTHFLHDATNDGVARDREVGPPRHLRWSCGPRWLRSHEHTSSFIDMVSSSGRVFYIVDEGLTGITWDFLPEQWTLTARDAFSGVELWKRRFAKFRGGRWNNRSLRGVPDWVRRLLVASGDRVYVPIGLNSPVSILDAATGREVALCEGTDGATEIRCSDGAVLVCAGKAIHAFEAEGGRPLWKYPAAPASNTLAIERGCVFFADSDGLTALDLESGEVRWRESPSKGERGNARAAKMLVAHGDYLVVVRANRIDVVRSKSGETLWSKDTPIGGRGEVFVTQGQVWHWLDNDSFEAHDLATGESVATVAPSEVFTPGHHLRCYQSKATEDYLITPYRGVEFISVTGDRHTQSDWLRGPCTYGVMPANGLLYVPPHPCFCYPGVKLTGFNVLAAESGDAKDVTPTPRLLRGPAFDEARMLAADTEPAGAWPTYRHDARRTGATLSAIPSEVTPLWETRLRPGLTPPVADARHVYVAEKDRQVLHAIDQTSGRQAWEFIAGGRIDSPPTLLGNLVLFGCADGHVYCLRNTDGALVWRFRAAPRDQRIVSFGRLESPWPVHGSVLVRDGLVYCTAGRSSYLDGGIHVMAIDPVQGNAVHETTLDTWSPTRDDAVDKPFVPAYHMEGTLSDILVSENDSIYLGQYRFNPALEQLPCPYVVPEDGGQPARGMDLEGKPFVAGSMEETQELETHQRAWLERAAQGIVSSLRQQHGAFNIGHRQMGRHVLTTFGFLDDSWFNRTFWMYSDSWPGFYFGHRASKSGQLLVVGPDRTYAVQAYPERNMQSPLFMPGESGYLLVADANDNEPVLDDRTRETTKGWGFTRSRPPVWHDWVPIRIRAMALADERLFVVGPPDVVDPAEPMAVFEGRKGALLRTYSRDDGEVLYEIKLPFAPVFDGLIGVPGRLLMSTQDGRVVCLGREE